MLRCALAYACSLLLLGASLLPAAAQNPAVPAAKSGPNQPGQSSPGPNGPTYTLDVGTRLVIEDVSVTDKAGNPVTGLPQSAFHVQDDGTPQTIRDFSEQSGPKLTDLAKTESKNAYTNASLYRSGSGVVALLIDPVSLALPDQMFLRLQMLRYLEEMPEGTPVAIFRANSRGTPVLIQSLTSDRALLVAAVNASVPGIPRGADAFGNAMAELENISDYLRPVPGKKVLLWFAGRFPLYIDPEDCSSARPHQMAADCASLEDARKEAFRALEQARIAVYPIDARGVLNAGPPARAQTNTALANSPGSVAAPPLDEGSKISGQCEVMDQLADATGGRAYYSNNALAVAIASAVHLGEHSYTVTYQPEPYKADARWHKVRVTVDGRYTVRYREGYYAGEASRPASAERKLLTTAGPAPSTKSATSDRSRTAETAQDAPIIFSAHLQPTGQPVKSGKPSSFLIEYTIPARELAFNPGANGTQHARLRLVALAYNTEGDVLGDAMDSVETNYTQTQMQSAARVGTPALQTIDIRKGSRYLLLAVEDLATQRVGTLQLPLADVRAEPPATR